MNYGKDARYAAQKRGYEPLTDESLMPYGQHKGWKMKDVPRHYLRWLADEGKCNKAVRAYISDKNI